jgi:hypothetical protein
MIDNMINLVSMINRMPKNKKGFEEPRPKGLPLFGSVYF